MNDQMNGQNERKKKKFLFTFLAWILLRCSWPPTHRSEKYHGRGGWLDRCIRLSGPIAPGVSVAWSEDHLQNGHCNNGPIWLFESLHFGFNLVDVRIDSVQLLSVSNELFLGDASWDRSRTLLAILSRSGYVINYYMTDGSGWSVGRNKIEIHAAAATFNLFCPKNMNEQVTNDGRTINERIWRTNMTNENQPVS